MSTIHDNEYFISFAKELDSKLGRINSLINNHPGEKGNYHEYILKDLISHFLPKRYSVRTGFIYVDDDHISPQIDLIIIDEDKSPCILAQYSDFVIVYPEAVCCTIEVKTFLNKKEFQRSTNFVQKVKEISRYNNPEGEMIGSLIFSFDGEIFTPRRLSNWYKDKNSCDVADYPDAILSLKKGFIMKWNLNNEHRGHYFIMGDEDELKWKSLSIFIAIIIKYCELRSGITRPDGKNAFDRFSKMENLRLSREYLKYHEGLLTRRT